MTRILITGANGQVGFELKRALAPLGDVVALTRQELDLARVDAIHAELDRYQPTIIVNPAAYTAVDCAESELEQAFAVNAQAPAALADWAERHEALLVHYSTDYVFDGTQNGAYGEDDAANPQSVYGRSKWEGEQAIRAATAHHLILRTSWVFGAHGNNFLKTILRLAKERSTLSVVADQVGAPTPAALIADVTAQLLSHYRRPTHRFEYGTYHLSAGGEANWYDYARYVIALAERAGIPLALKPDALEPIPTIGYPLPAPRPANSRLDCDKLKRTFGLNLPDWRQGVDQVFAQLNP
ncbi:dTDP-4-dehydrorhamnose reductase [Crenobacter cavernae]|uniref:dTDP-4-dehydrorhamnose reductase n=1 Tax=Crenobacter cavernae TaxID=2290923 RepID=A0A345Y520_9NEIS|nr:dTDP-4-dehydrorhamnose reductase [Crenobacter cavernae]AXK39022.1 dTDP-4-dehydrorhamnose reductase [Crenobacter cavernae]